VQNNLPSGFFPKSSGVRVCNGHAIQDVDRCRAGGVLEKTGFGIFSDRENFFRIFPGFIFKKKFSHLLQKILRSQFNTKNHKTHENFLNFSEEILLEISPFGEYQFCGFFQLEIVASFFMARFFQDLLMANPRHTIFQKKTLPAAIASQDDNHKKILISGEKKKKATKKPGIKKSQFFIPRSIKTCIFCQCRNQIILLLT
jgi:hypothetical protein